MLAILVAIGLLSFPATVESEEILPVIVVETPVQVVEVQPLTIEEKITAKAIEYGVDPTLALAIAKAESNFNPDAKNKESSASGLYQYIDGTFLSFCVQLYGLTDSLANKNNPDVQIECAMRMLSEGGESHWYASRHVWDR